MFTHGLPALSNFGSERGRKSSSQNRGAAGLAGRSKGGGNCAGCGKTAPRGVAGGAAAGRSEGPLGLSAATMAGVSRRPASGLRDGTTFSTGSASPGTTRWGRNWGEEPATAAGPQGPAPPTAPAFPAEPPPPGAARAGLHPWRPASVSSFPDPPELRGSSAVWAPEWRRRWSRCPTSGIPVSNWASGSSPGRKINLSFRFRWRVSEPIIRVKDVA